MAESRGRALWRFFPPLFHAKKRCLRSMECSSPKAVAFNPAAFAATPKAVAFHFRHFPKCQSCRVARLTPKAVAFTPCLLRGAYERKKKRLLRSLFFQLFVIAA